MSKVAFRSLRQSGFTLLELLIALVLTGLLSMLVYGGMSVGVSSWEKVIDRNEEVSDAFLTQRFIRRLIEDADSETVAASADAKSSVGFLGLENEMLFIAQLPSYESFSEQLWIFLSVVLDEEGIAWLQLATAPYDPYQPVNWALLLHDFRNGQETRQYQLVASVIEQIEFQYMEIDEQGYSRWQPEWRFLAQMPAAVQIRFLSENRVVKDWPEQVVSLQDYVYEIRNER
jgi:prepilin-type N-terminal cleavage/methylation domain-containing protein